MVFGTFVPPDVLFLFLPDKLIFHEIARQAVFGGIRKDLKGISKKVWPPFSIPIGSYSLLDFGHAKSKATTLEEMKLVNIEFKKHNPNKVVSNHLENCGLKRYEHEDSPHDEIFWGARSYSEVLSWIQALPPEEMVDFLKFEEHGKSFLPPILQGKTPKLPNIQKIEAKGSNNLSPGKEKNQEGTE